MFDEAELSSWETSGLLCSRSLDYGFMVVPSRRTMFDEAETSSDVERILDFVRGDPPLFDEAETSSGAHRNLGYRVQGLAPAPWC